MNEKEFIRAVNANQIDKVREMLPIISPELLNMMHDSRALDGEMAAIHVAAAKGHIEILNLLVNDTRIKINVNSSGRKFNPLQFAALNGHVEACELLFPLCEVLNPESKRAYFLATQEIDESKKDTEEGIRYKRIADLLRVPTFIRACETGNLQIIKLMVDEGVVDINGKCDDNWGLKAASKNGHIAVVDYLLSLPQIDVNMVTSQSNTLLHLLCARKSLQTARLPLEDCSFTAPSVRFQLIEKLIKHGADVNANNAEGYTPIKYATASNLLDAVKALVSNGANLTLKYRYDSTAGCTAEEFANSKKRMRQLIDNKIEMNGDLHKVYAPYLKGEDDLDLSFEEFLDSPRGVYDLDIFSMSRHNHPEIYEYLEDVKKYGSGELGFIKAANEKLRTLLFEHKKNRQAQKSVSYEQELPMSPKHV